MLILNQIIIEHFVQFIRQAYLQSYSQMEEHYCNIVAWAARLSLEHITNSDALYHNIDHTVRVTSVALSIIQGRHVRLGGVTPRDWAHFIMAALFHDIGYVKGVCRDDGHNYFATGIDHQTVKLPMLGSDIALMPYHVDRGKCFVRERFGGSLMKGVELDPNLIESYIEATRFPPPPKASNIDTGGYPGLLRAADFIGQLGDPDYLRKTPALFYEFQEAGLTTELGYNCPADLRRKYAKFYWAEVRPYIQDALAFLRITQEGKQWIANLHSHVFTIEHEEE